MQATLYVGGKGSNSLYSLNSFIYACMMLALFVRYSESLSCSNLVTIVYPFCNVVHIAMKPGTVTEAEYLAEGEE